MNASPTQIYSHWSLEWPFPPMTTGHFRSRTLLGLRIAREHGIYERVSCGPDPAVQSCTELPTYEFWVNDLNSLCSSFSYKNMDNNKLYLKG